MTDPILTRLDEIKQRAEDIAEGPQEALLRGMFLASRDDVPWLVEQVRRYRAIVEDLANGTIHITLDNGKTYCALCGAKEFTHLDDCVYVEARKALEAEEA